MGIRFSLGNRTKNSGKVRIYLTYTYRGKRGRVILQEEIEEKFWDQENQRVRKSFRFSSNINMRLSREKEKILTIVNELKDKNEDPAPETVIDIYKGNLKRDIGLWDAWGLFEREYLSRLKPLTAKNYRSCFNVLREYEIKSKSKLTFERMNMAWLKKYQSYLIVDRENKKNTVSSHIKHLKAFLGYAKQADWTKAEHFRQFQSPFSTPQGKIYLTLDELKKLELVEFELKKHERVRDLFLFHCDTGLRYQEGQNLTSKSIKDGILYVKSVKTQTGEPDRFRIIKLSSRALSIWNKYNGLPIYSNQKFNQYIKEACRISGVLGTIIHKGKEVEKWSLVKTHTGRESFATNMLEAGVDIRIVQKMLGHKSQSMTRDYDKSGPESGFLAIDNVLG